jgi:hypothetical protein
MQVKLTTAVVLREHALYEKQLLEERQRLEAFEVELRDDSDYRSWKVLSYLFAILLVIFIC